MATATAPAADTIADLLERLGEVPARRVRLHPAPGTATERDVLAIEAAEGRRFELIDGTLVEKSMGYYEARVAHVLAYHVEDYLGDHDLGIAAGPDGMLRLGVDLVRIPDLSFIAWERLPGRVAPRMPIPAIAPDLAVEVLSESSTRREMDRKLRDYFDAGSRLVWIVDPLPPRSVLIYTSIDRFTTLTEADTLDGGEVLPGFSLPIAAWFRRVDRGSAAL